MMFVKGIKQMGFSLRPQCESCRTQMARVNDGLAAVCSFSAARSFA